MCPRIERSLGGTLPIWYDQAVALMGYRGYTHVRTVGGDVPLAEWRPTHVPARWRGALLADRPDQVADLWLAAIPAVILTGRWTFVRHAPSRAEVMRSVLITTSADPNLPREELSDHAIDETE